MTHADIKTNPVQIGLVGLGYWGTRVAEAAAATPEITITRCFARTEATREAFAATYGCRPASSYAEMLADDDIEAVALITPNRAHHGQIMPAIEHGKHIFVDKPVTATLEEGVEVVKAVREAGLVMAVDHECRWEPPVRKMKQMLDEGVLGHVLMVEGNISTTTGTKIQPTEWRWHRSECPGGPLIQIGIHHIDLLQYLLGPIIRVHGWQKHQVLDAPIDDTTVTLLEFKDGTLGYLGSGYAAARSAWIHVYGGAAVGIYDRFKGLDFSGTLLDDDPERWRVPPASYDDPIVMIQDALADFARCVRTGRRPEVTGLDSLTALAVVLGAVKSNETARSVDIREFLREAGADW